MTTRKITSVPTTATSKLLTLADIAVTWTGDGGKAMDISGEALALAIQYLTRMTGNLDLLADLGWGLNLIEYGEDLVNALGDFVEKNDAKEGIHMVVADIIRDGRVRCELDHRKQPAMAFRVELAEGGPR